ncbi:unnamed protein product [Phytophthora fragariaefolia]|uniref:Unnamed protein product n=1 Tax=Phytophthora fragariaefolia TaxID=1490495 RepID=A0A9W6XS40_9STRA|nr:unnamed protein product [Phytophthora fragariaefolia]
MAAQAGVEAVAETADAAPSDVTESPTAVTADAPPPVQGDPTRRSTARTIRSDSGGPFAMPRREWIADEDVDLEDVSEEVPQLTKVDARPSDTAVNKRVQTMPTLPTPPPPVFRGSTSQEKQTFMKGYEAYCRQLSALETTFFRPFRMPVGACVEDERRRLIAMFDICKPLDTISESDWVDYFWEGRISGELDFEKVKTIMGSKLRMDTRLADANSRVSKLAHEMYPFLEKENMEWMVEGEPKKVVNYIMDALAPQQFQRTVRNEMARECNKPLLKNVVAFITWLLASCKEYLRWEPTAVKRSTSESSNKQGPRKTESTTAPQNRSQVSSGASVARNKRTCLKCCSEAHLAKECPQTKAGEAEALLREWREKNSRKGVTLQHGKPFTPVHSIKALQLTEIPLEAGSSCVARVENAVDLSNVLLDSGADVNVVSHRLIKRLQEQGVTVHVEKQEPHKMATFDGGVVEVIHMVRLDVIQIQTTTGPLLLRQTPTWVFEQETTRQDLQDLASAEGKPFEDIHLIRDVGLHGPDPDLRAATPGPAPIDPEQLISQILGERVLEAAVAGLDTDQVTRLEGLLLELMRGGIPQLMRRWASPPRIVAKNEPGTYRMTVDTRAVNDRTEPIQWSMPMLESALGLLEGTSYYFTLDWFRGYWQLPLHKDSQEMFSIMTHRGIITPTRVLMGGTDAVAYCQHVDEEVCSTNPVPWWLDDILGYAADPVNLLEVLERVLAACRSFGLKIHPAKCHFFLREARWCGKIVSGDGIKHCPSRIEGLVSIPDPTNAGQLQQFMCAVNWMRQNIARYSELAAPLLEIVDAAAKDISTAASLSYHQIRIKPSAHLRLWNEYFCENPTYPEKLFRRRNRMSRALFERLMGAVVEHDADFEQRVGAVGKKGLTPLQKCSAAVRMLVYGCAADSLNGVVKGAESTLLAYTKKFCDSVLGAMKALVTPRSQLVVLGRNALPEVVAFLVGGCDAIL